MKNLKILLLIVLLAGVAYLGYLSLPDYTKAMLVSLIPQSTKKDATQTTDIAVSPTPIASPVPAGSPKPTRSPYPIYPDKGKTSTSFQVSQGQHDGPTFRSGILNPLIVTKGNTLTLSVVVESTNSGSISQVNGVFTLDHSTQDLTFTRKAQNGLQETWEAKIKLEDTVLYDYAFKLSATDPSGTSYMAFAMRSSQ